MISEVDIKDWEMSKEAVKLYDVPRNSIVCPADEQDFLVRFSHLDGMYSFCRDFVTDEIVHLAAWTDVFVWRKL